MRVRFDDADHRLVLDTPRARASEGWSRAAAWRLGELAPYLEGKAALAALVAALDTAPPEIHDGLAHAIATFRSGGGQF